MASYTEFNSRKLIDEKQRNWCEEIPQVLAAYRATVHEATGMTPNFVVFGKENRAPVDLVLGRPKEDAERRPTYNEYVESMTDRMEEAYAVVREQSKKVAQVRKRRYDLKVEPKKFAIEILYGTTHREGMLGDRRNGRNSIQGHP